MSREHFTTSARLLRMLGDKLIEDGRVALAELIKNGYDADANEVHVNFCRFDVDNHFEQQQDSRIIISDDGHGMTKDVIINSFLNIATSTKNDDAIIKKSPNGRVYLGSHGIGRFSLLKLGRKITIYTKSKEDNYYSLIWDFTKYNADFTNEIEAPILLSNIEVYLDNIDADIFTRYLNKETGTVIIIDALAEVWNIDKVKAFAKNMTTFSPFDLSGKNEIDSEGSFNVKIERDGGPFYYKNGEESVNINNYELDKLKALIDTQAVYKIESGLYNEKEKIISFDLSSSILKSQHISFHINKLKRFETIRNDEKLRFIMENEKCGDFKFNTYIFNFDTSIFNDFTKLTKEEKKFLKEYNIYLYRDGARVLPYGNAGIDWLEIEKLRAETRAGDYFSQGQLVGQIFITRSGNPEFQDKTSREGLIITSGSFDKLKLIYRTILEYIKVTYYDKDKLKEQLRIKAEEEKNDKLTQQISMAIQTNIDNENVVKALKDIKTQHEIVKANYQKRINAVEELAGAGMSVEVTTHELYSTLTKIGSKIFKQQEILCAPPLVFNQADAKKINDDIIMLQKIAMQQLENIQKLLVSRKQRVKSININREISEIIDLYSERFKEKRVNIVLYNNNDLVIAETIDAVIYQTICNLLDNSLYWLDDDDFNDRKIAIRFNKLNSNIIFADNGPGIEKDYQPYIFDAFFSGKGVKGRGLGLYISKRLLNKFSFDIRLARDNEKILEGANFVIEFGSEG